MGTDIERGQGYRGVHSSSLSAYSLAPSGVPLLVDSRARTLGQVREGVGRMSLMLAVLSLENSDIASLSLCSSVRY
jgi:hypothetical protein